MLTPDDIVNYPLKQAVRGYSVQQVDDLLDQVADTIERLQRRASDVEERLGRSEERLAAASETETTLKRTLVTAQRAAEQSLEEAKERSSELIDDARREAASIVEQARLEAEELRVEALQAARAEEAEIRRRRQALEGHIEALRIFEREYRARLRGHLEEQLRLLDEVSTRPLNASSDEGVPALDDEVTDAPQEVVDLVDPSHLGAATIVDDRQLTVRVRDEDAGGGTGYEVVDHLGPYDDGSTVSRDRDDLSGSVASPSRADHDDM